MRLGSIEPKEPRGISGMRITLVIPTFSSGGAERAMAAMANYWAGNDHEVSLITIAPVGDDFYPLLPRVRRIGLGMLGNSRTIVDAGRNNFHRVKLLRQELRASRPDTVISFLDTANVLTLLASAGLGLPVIVCEQIDPRQHRIGRVWEMLRRILYPRADAVVVVSAAMLNWAYGLVRQEAAKFIPNPMALSLQQSNRCSIPRPGGTIAAMGRLTRQKGFDLLLEAFARCADRHPDWSLVILGEGDERNRLEALRAKLGVDGRIRFLGCVSDPEKTLQQADLFVMSSRFEGFPLALLEAMACGLAVISTDCPTGPAEIIQDGVNGVLVPPNDVEALAAAMDRLMASHSERMQLGLRAVEVTERFGIEKVMALWDSLVQQTCGMQKV